VKAKIIVVSQNADVLSLISSTLEGEGHKVVTCDLPDTAVKKCKDEHADVLFIDAHIGDVPYATIIKNINEECPDTQVVLITSYAFPESMTKTEALDIQGYLIKPLTADKIKTVTKRALRQGELTRENRRLLLTVTAAKKEWEATVDAIEDPIFVTDFDYTILRANLKTFQRLGKGVKEIIGRKCYDVFHCAHEPLTDCPGKKARDSGEPATETLQFRGLKDRLTCSVYPQVFAAGGGLVHYMREPSVNAEQQAETMVKYEHLFDDARIPMLVVSSEDYRVTDANQRAIELLGYPPEQLADSDLENLFAPSLRETVINNIVQQVDKGEAPLKVKIVDFKKKEVDVFAIAAPVMIGSENFVQLFLVPTDLLSGAR
jgi:PAS domain S-box-containing protein